MDKIKIIIVDDEKLIRQGLKIILSIYEDIEVISLCENGRIAYEFCRENKVDVVLMLTTFKDSSDDLIYANQSCVWRKCGSSPRYYGTAYGERRKSKGKFYNRRNKK